MHQGGTPPGMVGGGSEGRCKGRSGGGDDMRYGGRDSSRKGYRRGDEDGDNGSGEGGRGGGYDGDGDNRSAKPAEVSGPIAGIIWEGESGGGGHMAENVTDTQGGRGIPRHSTSGGGVEGSGGYSQSPPHSLH